MSGWIDEEDYSTVKEQQLSAQCELAKFAENETTYIAVVSLPRYGIEKYVDEVCTDLGMPKKKLEKFLAVRSGYRTNSAVECPHERAYDELCLTEEYREYLTDSPSAQYKLQELTDRVVGGENITLVCYEEDGKSCHRHVLVNEIRKRVEKREQSRFTFTSQSSNRS